MPHTLRNEPDDSAEVRAGKAAQRRAYFGGLREQRGRKVAGHAKEAYVSALGERERARERRAEQLVARDLARYEWEDLKRSIGGRSGGIQARSVGEDYRSLPRELRSRSRHASDIHHVAEENGFSDADAFVRHVATTKERYEKARREKLERVPRAPKKPKELRLKPGERHAANPHVKHLLSEYRDMAKLVKDAEQALGRNGPGMSEMRADLLDVREEYRQAARDAGEEPARV